MSFIYNSALEDAVTGKINFNKDKFKVMLCREYSPDKNDRTRSDVTDEVSGPGYTPGGQPIEVKVMQTAGKIDIVLGAVLWKDATITASKAVYYKSRGAGADLDELVAVVDFGGVVSSTKGDYSLSQSTLRIQS
jgi:hypothetical protein